MKNKLLLILLFPLFAFTQQFADKEYYLIDSLVLEDLSKTDKNLIDSCLKVYHRNKVDTIKIKSINSIIDQCYNETVWPKYNLWLNKLSKEKLKTTAFNIFYKKEYATTLNNIGYLYNNQGNTSEALKYYNKSLKIYKEINDKEGEANSLNNIGEFHESQGDVKRGMGYYKQALKIQQETEDKNGIVVSLDRIGTVNYNQGNIEKALDYFHQALKIKEETKNKSGIANSLNNIGAIYKSQGEIEKTLEYLKKSLKIREELEDKNGISSSLNNIGYIYNSQGNKEKALEYYNKSLELFIELGRKDKIAASFNNIGTVYKDKGDSRKALEYYNKSLKIREEIKHKKGIIISLQNIASIYIKNANIKNAKKYLSRAFKMSKQLGYPNLISSLAKKISNVSLTEGNYQKAYEMHTLHIKMRDSINNINTQKAVIEQEEKYKYEKQKAIDDLENEKQKIIDGLENQKKLELEGEKNKKQFIITLSVVSLLLLTLLFLILIYRKLQETKEQQKQEAEVKQHQLEEANKEINDSINYAELIQKSVLPTLKMSDLNNSAFIYFNPKDRISGDFYWLEQKEQYSGYCVADCTGHGIPGAFISMIGTILMNEIYNSKQLKTPEKVLSELSRLIELTLTDRDGNKMKDGMDMSLVLLNNEHKLLYFSGANNSVWIISKSPQKQINKKTTEPIFEYKGKYMYEIKGDKQPIGFYENTTKPFSLHKAELIEGDTFYLFTDGYVDQFGGERNKKFKAKAFRELLLSINLEDMDSQKNILSEHFESWKGEYEQIDDVTVMGVRV